MKKFDFCSYCGVKYSSESWPRVCLFCCNMVWSNPLPVAVLIVPVADFEEGALLVRRSIPPFIGQLALPGGYLVVGESWQQGAARELFEETGIEVKPEDIVLFDVTSNENDNHSNILIFGRTRPVDTKELECFHTNEEVSELIVTKVPVELCFPTHTKELAKFFADESW